METREDGNEAKLKAGEDRIIRRILEDGKFKRSRVWEEMEYRDEPIILKASQMKNFTPRKYREMEELIKGRENLFKSAAELFYIQGKFMEDFTDSYSSSVELFRYYPTYRDLTLPQLRTYFSWRTEVRKGEIKDISRSYVYLYIYELLNQIGVRSPEEGLLKLKALYQFYFSKDRSLVKSLKEYIKDYCIYYGIAREHIREFTEEEFHESFAVLRRYSEEDEAEIFSALCALSAYTVEKSSLYRKYPAEYRRLSVDFFRSLSEYCQKNRKLSLLEKLFGKSHVSSYYPMYNAVFFERERKEYFEYRLSETVTYRCVQGSWTEKKAYRMSAKSKELGTYMKNVDNALRLRLGLKPLSVSPLPPKLEEILEKTVQDYFTRREREKEEEERKEREISIDFSKLSRIRENAGETRERLLTEEERDFSEERAFPEEETFAKKDDFSKENSRSGIGDSRTYSKKQYDSERLNSNAQNMKSLNSQAVDSMNSESDALHLTSPDFPLSEIEREFLHLLLKERETEARNYLKTQRKLVNLIIDHINELFYEVIGDTVLEISGEKIELIEDYIEDVREKIQK